MTPHDLFRLERKLANLAFNGMVPQIVGIHSITVEGTTANVIFDLLPDVDGSGLNFAFEVPTTHAACREELKIFLEWLFAEGTNVPLH
jgi:hypothetical protein